MRISKSVVAVACAVVVSAGVTAGVSAAVLSPSVVSPTTYYACLKTGALTKVGTVAPTCTAPAVKIAWYSTTGAYSKAQVSAAISAANGGLCAVPVSGTANADLHGCNLAGKDLTGWSLPSVRFNGANLANASLDYANLTSGDLSGADLVNALMTSANLTGANLTGADMAAVDLRVSTVGAPGHPAYLNGADLEGVSMQGVQFNNASLLDTDLSSVLGLNQATFTNTICPDGINSDTIGHTCVGHESPLAAAVHSAQTPHCTGYPHDQVDWSIPGSTFGNGCDLDGANLTGAEFLGANLTNASLIQANLTSAQLFGANLTGANLFQANLTGAHLFGANLTGANLFDATMTGANDGGVTWSNTTCPDNTNSNNDGGTCSGHGAP